MSFISILKKVGSAIIGAEHQAAPIAEALLPQFAHEIAVVDTLVTRIQSAITTVESNNPVLDGQLKAQAVIADFQAALGLTNAGLALKHEAVSYDTQALQDAINAQVAAYNAFSRLKDSLKIVSVTA